MATSTAPRKRKRLTACDSRVQKEVISFREVRNLINLNYELREGKSLLLKYKESYETARCRLQETLSSLDLNHKVTCGSRIICQPSDLRMIVVSTIPDNALLRKLRVLHPTKFWIFSPIDKNSVLSR